MLYQADLDRGMLRGCCLKRAPIGYQDQHPEATDALHLWEVHEQLRPDRLEVCIWIYSQKLRTRGLLGQFHHPIVEP
jgi:hypothetical protein